MEQQEQLDYVKYQKAITPLFLFVFHTVYSVFIIAITVVWIYFGYSDNQPSNVNISDIIVPLNFSILILIFICISLLFYVGSVFLCKKYFNPQNLSKIKTSSYSLKWSSQGDTPEQKYLMAITQAMIGRIALFGGVALLGGILFYFMRCDISQKHFFILYFISFLPFPLFLLVAIYTFPTSNKLETIFKKQVLYEK